MTEKDTMQTFRQTINQVVAANSDHNDTTNFDLGESVRVERDGYENLSISRIRENKVSVMHTYKQRHDLMRDPEIVFDTEGDEWLPVEFRQDSMHYHEHNQNGVDCGDFLQSWAGNLEFQGFTQ